MEGIEDENLSPTRGGELGQVISRAKYYFRIIKRVFVSSVIGYFSVKRFVCFDKAGVAQLVEHQPSKLRVAGSIPVSRSKASNLYC